MNHHKLSRRRMLMGSGATLALPLLATRGMGGLLAGAGERSAPQRLVFLNFGYGTSESWFPGTVGADYQLTEALAPLERHRQSFSVLGNLTNLQSAIAEVHWGATTFLTSANTRSTPGTGFRNDISCDQIAAQHLGKDVRFPSLELTGPQGTTEGAGPGASLAWDERGNPIPGEWDHVELFERLFGGGGLSVPQRRQLLKQKRSVLDVVRLDAKDVAKQVGSENRQKLEEYFELIRSIEGRLGRDEDWLEKPLPKTELEQPPNHLQGTADIEMMFDLMTAAMQTDSTRVITYRMPTTTLLREFGEQTGTHVNSHAMTHFGHKNTPEYRALLWRDKKLSSLLASLMDKLKAARDVDGSSVLDNTTIVMGAGIRTGHLLQNLPIILAGHGVGPIRHGAHYQYRSRAGRLSNLWLTLLQRVGCPVNSFADSEGPLTEMFG